MARKPRSPDAALQRNVVELSRDTISILRKPESSSTSLAHTRDSREYREFLSAMFAVGVHRSERTRWLRDASLRALRGTDRPIFGNRARTDTTVLLWNSWVRVFTTLRQRVACGMMVVSVVVAESIADPETFSVRNVRSLIQLQRFRRTEFSLFIYVFSAYTIYIYICIYVRARARARVCVCMRIRVCASASDKHRQSDGARMRCRPITRYTGRQITSHSDMFRLAFRGHWLFRCSVSCSSLDTSFRAALRIV